jgi:predicted chitinase
MVESIKYTATRACVVWPSRFNSEASCYATVGSFAGDPNFPVKLIDNVYGTRMGNRPGTHDGSRYIGRGFGPMTSTALKEFQQDHGLEANGTTGPETFVAFEKELAKL